jgi:hypothetical protein
MVRRWMNETGQREGVEYAELFHVAPNGWRPPQDSDAELAAPSTADD